jgi:histidinol-phosphatase (PHP family)
MSDVYTDIQKVSVHGGHSGQFCHHARDSLESVIRAYIDQGFTWVGITEHMAPISNAWRYPDEQQDNLTADFLLQRFRDYFTECRALAGKYAGRIEIMTAFETETHEGSEAQVKKLVDELRPDYLVGSVHHVAGHCIDYDAEHFQRAVEEAGGLVKLYCAYFDVQYDMLCALEPAVVGHFDLIRKFDVDYQRTLQYAAVWERIERNLNFIAEKNLILDFNLRGFDRAMEQYPSMPALRAAIERGIAIVPGDDSHGVKSVGRNYVRGVSILLEMGVDTLWRKPQKIQYGN